MRCPTCQSENPDGAPFCAECGLRLAPTAGLAAQATGALPQQTVLQNRYVISGKLGQGGMGAVYRAGDRHLSTITWAIKEMSEAAITGPLERQQAREAFRREAEMLAALAHPNLPRVVDHFEQDGKAYLVMEYVPGETLWSLLLREGLPQHAPRVLEWARQLCAVLEYLHAQSPPIIFRDLKPANIMITPQGQIKLIDFGIARLFKPGQAQDTQAFGTAGYSAPEQYGRGQTDARSDVYALGVLLHQLLTGYDPTTTPFRLPPAALVNPSVPARLSAALARATESEPARRFPSVRAFYDALAGDPGDVVIGPGAGALGQGAPGGAIYAYPNSQPFVGAGLPAGAPSGAAKSSRWIGIASLALMGLAMLLVLVARARGEVSGSLAGLGYLLGGPALIGGPVALILGVLTLIQPPRLQTVDGRRFAIMGIATGSVALLLCCAILVLVGSAGK